MSLLDYLRGDYSPPGNHSLTAKEVKEIREKYATGRIRQVDLAEEYSVSQSCISRIVTRKRWKEGP